MAETIGKPTAARTSQRETEFVAVAEQERVD